MYHHRFTHTWLAPQQQEEEEWEQRHMQCNRKLQRCSHLMLMEEEEEENRKPRHGVSVSSAIWRRGGGNEQMGNVWKIVNLISVLSEYISTTMKASQPAVAVWGALKDCLHRLLLVLALFGIRTSTSGSFRSSFHVFVQGPPFFSIKSQNVICPIRLLRYIQYLSPSASSRYYIMAPLPRPTHAQQQRPTTCLLLGPRPFSSISIGLFFSCWEWATTPLIYIYTQHSVCNWGVQNQFKC